MSDNRIYFTKGLYHSIEAVLFMLVDDHDRALEIQNLNAVTLVGNCYVATVEKVLDNINGAVLKLDDDGTKGFLHTNELFFDAFVKKTSKNKTISQGDVIKVCVTKDAFDNKYAVVKPVSNIIAYDDDGVSYSKSMIYSLLDRMNPDEISDVVTDLDDIYKLLEHFASNNDIWKDKIKKYDDLTLSMWSLHGIEKQLDRAIVNICHLDSGANIVIEHTEALTVIDVNSAHNIANIDRDEFIFQINKEAAREVARQIRLRNISGMIVVDFINMDIPKYKTDLYNLMCAYCSSDYCQVDIYGFTKLGLFEISRERRYKSLRGQLGINTNLV